MNPSRTKPRSKTFYVIVWVAAMLLAAVALCVLGSFNRAEAQQPNMAGREPTAAANTQPPPHDRAPRPAYQQPQEPIGTLYFTSNLIPSQNRLLVRVGVQRWNHVAILVGDTDGDGRQEVIEAQSGPPYGYGVQSVSRDEFLARPYYTVAYWPIHPCIGQRAAWYARCCLGRPYGRAASIGPGIVRDILGIQRENCTSLIEDSYGYAVGRRMWGVVTPDDLVYAGVVVGPFQVARAEVRP